MITLHNVEGIASKSGMDSAGNLYIDFEVDYFAEQMDGECAQCGAVLSGGWMCLDGSEEFCYDHVRFCKYPDQCKQCERLIKEGR